MNSGFKALWRKDKAFVSVLFLCLFSGTDGFFQKGRKQNRGHLQDLLSLITNKHMLSASRCSVEKMRKATKKGQKSRVLTDLERSRPFFFAGNPSDFGRNHRKRPLTSMRKHVPTPNVHTTYLVLYLSKTGTYQLALGLVFCNEDLFR